MKPLSGKEMKVGDLVRLQRYRANSLNDEDNLYIGIYLKEEYGDWYVECGFRKTGRFSPDFWTCEVVNASW
tara:strand:+ start:74 stop:286 length:213 start_codon:yes stop_codon:yes gene_type:complete